MNVLYAVRWEEYERGWGSRPDGYSFHRTLPEAKNFITKIYNMQPEGFVPDEYSITVGEPILMEVSADLHAYVTEHGNIWLEKNHASQYLHYDASHLWKWKVKNG